MTVQKTTDMISAAAAAGAATGFLSMASEWLSIIAAFLAIVWFGIRFWDRFTGKSKGY